IDSSVNKDDDNILASLLPLNIESSQVLNIEHLQPLNIEIDVQEVNNIQEIDIWQQKIDKLL
ncbi:28044_t:CDS:1, partial [Racocetra persica]